MSVFELLNGHPLVFAGVLLGGLIGGALIAELLTWTLAQVDPDGRIVVRHGDKICAEMRTDEIAAEARRRDGSVHITGWTDAAGQRHPVDVSVHGTQGELYFEVD